MSRNRSSGGNRRNRRSALGRVRRRRRLLAATAGLAVGGLVGAAVIVVVAGEVPTAFAGADDGTDAVTTTAPSEPSYDVTVPPTAPSTTEAPTTTAPSPPPEPEFPVYRVGDSGFEVGLLEHRLTELKYDVPSVDGVYDEGTRDAVMAFQKVYGLSRDGNAGPQTLGTMATVTSDPPPMLPNGEPDRVEVDLDRQVAFLYLHGQLAKILSASTGSGEVFCEGGRCRKAVTPTGDYSVYHRVKGWQDGDLGRLYNPLYFNGGIALHGSENVPATPASHGCVRLPMNTAEWLPLVVPNGMPVHVLDP